MKRYQKKWYIKDIYHCYRWVEECGECYLSEGYFKTEEREGPGGTFWGGWEKVGTFTRDAIQKTGAF